MAGKAAELTLLKRSEHKLDTSITDAFHLAMPGEQSALNARMRMEARLNAAHANGSSGGLLSALEAVAQARNAAPGTVVQALNFHEGALEMKVSAPDASSLDRVTQTLKSVGWQADLTSGNVVSSGYEGHIEIRPNRS